MAFTSLNFLLFALLTVIVYYAIPVKGRWLVLLFASYAFYLLSSPKTFIFVLFTTAVTFFCGRSIGRCNSEHKAFMAENKASMSRDEKKAAKAANQKRKKKYVAIALILDFGILAVLKYFRYYLEALGLGFDLGGILIPLGISFYTFQSAAYIIDIYRDKISPDTNIARFALFTAFFPQIIQGPISRHDQLAHQLYEGHEFDYRNLTHGAQLVLWGFFKKLVIADRVAILCDQVFDNYGDYSGEAVFVALLFYTIQIYADFSGGIDIARGVARCMGIDMTNNFMRPYFSDSLSSFWNRWHISLSHWCRDYIFYPVAMSKFFGKLGKNLRGVLGDRVGKLVPVIIAQYATFITIGIWHGAEFKYIAYGLYNGTVIVLGLLLEPYFRKIMEKLHINASSRWWKGFHYVRTFFIVVFGRIFPKAASFGAALTMFASMFRLHNGEPFAETLLSLGLNETDFLIILVSCIVWLVISLVEERDMRMNGGDGTAGFRQAMDRMPLPVRWILILLMLTAVMALGVYGPGYDAGAFIYRGF